MKNIVIFGLAVLFSVTSLNMVRAENEHQGYALDKLANAQAQLDRLKAQKKAINELMKAVKKDLRAAKLRAKAERIQLSADTDRQDAAVAVEQTGVAVDLPNLMAAKGVQAGLKEYSDEEEDMEMMFKDKKTKSVYFPGGSKVDADKSDSEIPDYIK